MPYSFVFSVLASTPTVGWSITTAGMSVAFWEPTSRLLIFASPMLPMNAARGDLGMPLSSPASLANSLLTNEIGAPVSKMRRYGPLPLTLTMTAMCPDLSISKGTVDALGASFFAVSAGSAVKGIVATRAARMRCFMSDALPGLERQLFGLLAALDGQLHRAAAGQLAGEADDIADAGDAPALDLGHHVAGLDPRHDGRPLGEDGLDARVLVAVLERQAEDASERHLGRSLSAEELADALHQAAHHFQPAGPALDRLPQAQRRRRLVVQLRPLHLGLRQVDLHAVLREDLVAHQ